MRYLKTLGLLLFIFYFISCKKEKTDILCQPKTYKCLIKLIDKSNRSLIGEDTLYHPDSIYMLINNLKWTTYSDSNGILWSYTGLDSLNESNYLLHLSLLETDTINFVISRFPGYCFDSFAIDTFKYNCSIILPDTVLSKNREVFKIIK